MRLLDGIAYEMCGSGPPLLFIHGITYDHRIWTPLVERLQDRATCIVVDLPGHGASLDQDNYELPDVAQAVQRLVAALEIEPPVIVGHSIGAFATLVYASQYPCRAAVVLDQVLDIVGFAQSMQRACSARTEKTLLDFWSAFQSGFGLKLLDPEQRKRAEFISVPRSNVLSGYWRVLLDTEPTALQAGIDAMLHAVAAPTCVMHGSDPGESYANWLGERILIAKLHVFEGGHFFFLKHPEAVASIIGESIKPGN